ncbi:acyltransferase family protein [Alkalimarinus coralli]|uniref:acyltransferase family protein n=1 Tax=Alkalimarinus coralli TaxID=2935863 RepID=UPI00202B69D7|nr:acyltransferase [Alkalimarinus coralli]
MAVRRLESLDGLRGVAAVAVLAFHYIYHYNRLYGHGFNVPEWTFAGYYGVHLFFLVSGFVIFWTLSKCEKPFDFIWSRFTRLYPVYWAALSLTFLAVSIYGLSGREVSLDTFVANLLMIHEYLGFKHVDGVYWTLTLELAFYFWMFLLFILNQLKNIEKWLLLWLTIAAMFFISGLDQKTDARITKFFLFDFIALFSAGICFYKVWSQKANVLTAIVLGASLALLFIIYSFKVSVGLTLMYFVFYLAISDKIKLLRNPVTVWLGGISYSLYLIHQNIGYMIIQGAYSYGVSPAIGITIATIVSILLAVILTYKVEKPSIIILRRIYQKVPDKISFFTVANKDG